MECFPTYGLGHISPYWQISHCGGGQANWRQRDWRPGGRQPRPRPRPCCHGHGVRRLVGGGGVSLLDWWKLAVVAAPVNSLGICGALEVLLKQMVKSSCYHRHLSHLVHAVSEAVGDTAHDGAPDLASRHLPELDRGRLAVKCGVRRHNQIWCLLQRRVACERDC